jgi:hypothetical protein
VFSFYRASLPEPAPEIKTEIPRIDFSEYIVSNIPIPKRITVDECAVNKDSLYGTHRIQKRK